MTKGRGMTGPADLPGKIQNIIDEAIRADMRQMLFYPAPGGGFSRHRIGGMGEAVVDDPIPGPGQGATGDIPRFIPGDGTTFNPTGDVYEKWDGAIRAVFEPWLSIPQGSDFDDKLGDVTEVMRRLATTAQPDDGENVIGANLELNKVTETAKDTLAQFSGKVVRTFKENYIDNFEDVVAGQYHLARMLKMTMAAEREVWIRAWDDLGKLADDCAQAMSETYDFGDVDWETVVKVVGSCLAVAGLYSGAGVVLKGVGTVVNSVLAKWVPKHQEDSTKRTFSAGTSTDSVFEELKKALTGHSTDISDQEIEIYDKVNDVIALTKSYPESFDLQRPDDMLDTTNPDDVVTDKDVIALESSELRDVGRRLLPAVAKELNAAGDKLEASTYSMTWMREGPIGMGYYGPWEQWYTLAYTLKTYLTDTAQELVQSGEILAICADSFDQTDASVSEHLKKYTKEIAPPPAAPGPRHRPDGY